MKAGKHIPEGGQDIRQRFMTGRFPVVTVEAFAERTVDEVLGLVVARGYNSEDTFFGMLTRAETKGAQGIIGYRESVVFHPDGSRFYTCYGTAVRLGHTQRAVPEHPRLAGKSGR